MQSLVVAAGDPDSPEARTLLAELDHYLASLYPGHTVPGVDFFSLRDRSVTFFLANFEGEAVGCGAYQLLDPGSAEIKLMYLRPDLRRRGFGKSILASIEQSARHAGVHKLLLEAGRNQSEALGLYERFGFHSTAPFADYRPDPLLVFYEKTIV